LNRLATTNNKTEEDDELLVVITPHVIDRESRPNTEAWLAK
jgi:type II secretory pathway component HofQ